MLSDDVYRIDRATVNTIARCRAILILGVRRCRLFPRDTLISHQCCIIAKMQLANYDNIHKELFRVYGYGLIKADSARRANVHVAKYWHKVAQNKDISKYPVGLVHSAAAERSANVT